MKSQNAKFKGDFPKDAEFEHPSGAWFARKLSDEVAAAGWKANEFENWRDAGWSIPCVRDKGKLEIAFAPWDNGEWMLQIAAVDSPGIIRSMFGAKPSASTSDLVSLAKTVHEILSRESHISNILWRIDGPPDDTHSTGEPM